MEHGHRFVSRRLRCLGTSGNMLVRVLMPDRTVCTLMPLTFGRSSTPSVASAHAESLKSRGLAVSSCDFMALHITRSGFRPTVLRSPPALATAHRMLASGRGPQPAARHPGASALPAASSWTLTTSQMLESAASSCAGNVFSEVSGSEKLSEPKIKLCLKADSNHSLAGCPTQCRRPATWSTGQCRHFDAAV